VKNTIAKAALVRKVFGQNDACTVAFCKLVALQTASPKSSNTSRRIRKSNI